MYENQTEIASFFGGCNWIWIIFIFLLILCIIPCLCNSFVF
jgi:hypothetical protein